MAKRLFLAAALLALTLAVPALVGCEGGQQLQQSQQTTENQSASGQVEGLDSTGGKGASGNEAATGDGLANENASAGAAGGEDANAGKAASAHYGTFSVIGDSYSTFSGWTTEKDAPQFYPASDRTGNDVTQVGQMWWSIFAQRYGSKLVENNSWSGRPVCHDGWASGDDDAHAYSFTTACESIGDPELVFIFGGTNDSWIGVNLGDYKYEGWTEGDLRTFRGALAYVIDKVRSDHPAAKVVFLLNSELSEGIDESARTICEHYGVDMLELKDVSKASSHPDSVGMQSIADQLIAYLQDA